MGSTNDYIIEKIEKITIDEFLRGLITDSDLEEVVSTLDMIARESGLKIEMYNKDRIRQYPA